ncbi:hypothetical protein [Streptomyces sp. AC512_CC834]|uniref:hypothetical protein n=1 Tax=Streptomyces sp. AC512_CC834 TaxID=2823691 RepID=UPI001C2630D2|nr:hypothetical protein [Streptomyces sp. AC512_CC834]
MYDGVEEQDSIGLRGAPGHAVQVGGDIETTLVRPSAPGKVTCFFPTGVGVLNVPGGGDRLIMDQDVLRDLRRAQEAGVVVAGVCTGVMVLSAAGPTKGRPCRTRAASTT